LALEKSEHDPNIFSDIYSEGFVFNAEAEAAALNDPTTDDSGVRVSRHVRRSALRPVAVIISTGWFDHKRTSHQQG
jgi:hypothetical protein